MTPTWRIWLLGGFRLRRGDAQDIKVASPRMQSLLAYLTVNRDSPQSRYHVAFVFWPDATEERALANLRKLLFDLRKAVPRVHEILDIETQTVQLRASSVVSADVSEFQDAVARANATLSGDLTERQAALEQATALYQGDLLPSCYDDWIGTIRQRLSLTAIEAMQQLVTLLEGQREYDAAIRYCHRVLQHDSVHEGTYRSLMRLYALKGDRAAVVRVFQWCVTQLQSELGVDPSGETKQLYNRLAQVGAPGASPELLRTGWQPLVGREREWAQLRGAWSAAAAGKPSLVVISGEAGIGTSRLADELYNWAMRQGFAVAAARCYPAERGVAYAPLVTWLRARPLPPMDDTWLRELARVLPEVSVARPDLVPNGSLAESWQKHRFFEATARALVDQWHPLLLTLDDMHWCDQETLEWLNFLLRRDPRARLLIVGTLRTGMLSPEHPLELLLDSQRRRSLLVDIEVGPLSEKENFQLAVQLAGRDLDPAWSEPFYRGSEGNPLFLVEMLRAGLSLSRPWSQHPTPSMMEQASLPLPPKVRIVIEERLKQLSPQARELAELASTIGRDFEFRTVALSSDLDESALVRALDELWSRHILRQRGEEAYDFSHDRIREVCYNALSPARRRLLHRRVAEALVAVHADGLDAVALQVAYHYDRAGQAERAVDWYSHAAETTVRRHAAQDAVYALRRAIQLLESEEVPASEASWATAKRLQLEQKLTTLLMDASRPEDTTDAPEKAAQGISSQESH